MNIKSSSVLIAILSGSIGASYACASDLPTPPRKHLIAAKSESSKSHTVDEQLQALRQQLESQAKEIDRLKVGLLERNSLLKSAEQSAAAAKLAALQAEAAAADRQRAVVENAAAVGALKSAVSGLSASQTALTVAVAKENATMKSEIENPNVLHYKGMTLTPSGFLNGESVYRSHATGGELPTPFNALPYEHGDSYGMSETYLSGRQSRIGLELKGITSWGVVRAYVEGDFLGVGTTSNDNQSNSYLFRQRVALAEVETKTQWTFSGGQGWTLALENKRGITTAVANMALPLQIDPNYVAGLVWSRGGGFRVTKNFGKAAFAISAENPQILYSASLAGNTPYAVLGGAGVNGGMMNAAMSSCSPSMSIVNYTNQKQTDSGGYTSNVAIPVYKTLNSCANLANISFNQAPDMLVKAAFDSRFGH